jgi:hypothetical protein
MSKGGVSLYTLALHEAMARRNRALLAAVAH